MIEKIYDLCLDFFGALKMVIISTVSLVTIITFPFFVISFYVMKNEENKQSYPLLKDKLNLFLLVVKKRFFVGVYFYIWLYFGYMVMAIGGTNIIFRAVELMLFVGVAFNMLIVASDLNLSLIDIIRRTFYLTIFKIHTTLIATLSSIVIILLLELLNRHLAYLFMPSVIIYLFYKINLDNYNFIRNRLDGGQYENL